ncbi:Aste57867_25296 [Aphanomyces stellatus]|uniref:Aste57867_25296 protein n=1 Tax=Aphanomyces stellatus TaxID=120398 RepID=A0A485LSQ0_9STRA|nr:hypothetical protein As57867_025218 [Aphanomyces stellatus]VFU01921.1 Aste57867_25296 [Aphanomyces stellatus]
MDDYSYNAITGATLSIMHVPPDVDAFVAIQRIRQDALEAKEARAMAWEDYFATQWGKQDRAEARKTEARLQAQIDELSKARPLKISTFNPWVVDPSYFYEYVHYVLGRSDASMRAALLGNVSYGLMPLPRACTTKDYRLVELLLQDGADPTVHVPASPYPYMQSIFRASVEDLNVFNLLVKYAPRAQDFCACDDDGLSLVHAAAQGGHAKVLDALLHLPRTHHLVNTVTKSGYTALHLAVMGGYPACVALILEHMSSELITCLTHDGYNALHLALKPESSHFHLDQLVESFITATCSSTLFEAVDPHGHTVIHLAVMQNLERIALRLIRLGKTPMNVCTKSGVAALHVAVAVKNPTIIRALHQHNAMIDIMDDNGQTPLLAAALINDAECMRTLLEFGADAGCQNKEGHAPLHYLASYCTDPTTFDLFLAKDVDVNCKSIKGNVPLHFAAMKGNEVAARILATHGADVSLLNEDKRSVVFLARQWGHLKLEEFFKFLIKAPTESVLQIDGGGGGAPGAGGGGEPATSDERPTSSSGGATRARTPNKDGKKKKRASVVLPSLRPITPAIDKVWDTESNDSDESERGPSSSAPPTRHVCMTPYVKRQLFDRVRAPHASVELSPEMEELLHYNQPPKPDLGHPQAKYMVRRCKTGVNVPWPATTPLAPDTLERRLKPSTKYQVDAAQHVKSMPELRADFQFARIFTWAESRVKRRSRHDARPLG